VIGVTSGYPDRTAGSNQLGHKDVGLHVLLQEVRPAGNARQILPEFYPQNRNLVEEQTCGAVDSSEQENLLR